MKVSELEGQLLDRWAALAQGWIDKGNGWWGTKAPGTIPGLNQGAWHPSMDWNQGGPIIEREQMTVWHRVEDASGNDWNACISLHNGYEVTEDGPTLLVAAMRAYVASKFGDEVPDEVPA